MIGLRLLLPLGLVAALLAGSCSRGAEPTAEEPVTLATLGTSTIDFERVLAASRARTAPGEFPRSGSGFEAFLARLLQDIVVEEVFLLEAEQRGLVLDADELQRAVTLAGEGVQDEDRLPEVLQERYGSEDVWRDVLGRRLLAERVEQVLRDELAQAVEIAEDQAREALPSFADELARPGRLRARQLHAADAEAMRAARQRLTEGEDFGELAQELNGDDGDMGWMSLSEAPAVVVSSTEALELGEITEVVHSPLGYHLFQVLGREAPEQLAEDAALARMTELLVTEAVDRALGEWLAQRTESLGLTVHDDLLEQVRCCRLGLPYFGEAVPEET